MYCGSIVVLWWFYSLFIVDLQLLHSKGAFWGPPLPLFSGQLQAQNLACCRPRASFVFFVFPRPPASSTCIFLGFGPHAFIVVLQWVYIGFIVVLIGMDIPELPSFDMGTLLTVLGGMLGIGGLRSYEKSKGLTKQKYFDMKKNGLVRGECLSKD